MPRVERAPPARAVRHDPPDISPIRRVTTGDYAAPSAGLRHHTADRVVDKTFAEANGLVVPTAGVHGANGSSSFPVGKVYLFTGGEGVDHGGYFANKVARDKLLDWLAE